MHNFSQDDLKNTKKSCFGSEIEAGNVVSGNNCNNLSLNCEVKWFHIDKGYGFVRSDDFEGDIFLHVSKIHEAGIDIALLPGDIIKCEINVNGHMQKPSVVKIFQCLRKNIDAKNLIKVKAIVKWFNLESDYGFVNNGHYDIFVSGTLLRKMHITEQDFYEGIEVECCFTELNNRKVAYSIKVLSNIQKSKEYA